MEDVTVKRPLRLLWCAHLVMKCNICEAFESSKNNKTHSTGRERQKKRKRERDRARDVVVGRFRF